MEGDQTNTTSDGSNNAIQRTRPLQGRTSGPTRRSTKGQWTPEEDDILRQAVQQFKGKNWKKIAECFKDRTDVQCLHRWQKVLNPALVKGPWSKEEDEVIIQLVKAYGPKKWSTIAQHLPGRIGKQCRERWHNHLNPTINREAWTQEEELALIRAHQIYGNKWAELTKFLPGRTDNAIKNHWNSSVKKKLNQYLASGLLQQFQGLPHVSRSNQSNASSLKVQQSSEDDVPKDGAELEEISECSQGSTIVGCSQSTGDIGNAVVHLRAECRVAEEPSDKKNQSSNPASCSENGLTASQEVACPILQVTHELGASSVYIERNSAHEWETSMGNDWQINSTELSKMTSQDLGQETTEQFMQYLNDSDEQQTIPFPLQDSMCFSTAIAVDEGFPSGIDINGVDGSADPILFQSSNYLIREEGSHFASQSCYYSSSTDMLATSDSQQPSVPQQHPCNDGSLIFGIHPNQFHDSFVANQEQGSLPDRHDGSNNGSKEQIPWANDASTLVEVNDIRSMPTRGVQTSVDKDPLVQDDLKDSGALCYEPPRFPSLEIPFLSCDLIQSSTDMLQEYSPLGTRQFWTSFNRMWDSPSGDKSPDAVLKNAAKSYTCTPSILKKRNRDLVSPLSEKRSEKKFEIDLKQKSFSNLSREFSRLDVMFDEVGKEKSLELSPSSNKNGNTEDKENINPDLGQGEKEEVKGLKCTTFPDYKLLPENVNSAPHGEIKQQIIAVDCIAEDEEHCIKTEGEDNGAAGIVNQGSGTLIEHDMSNLVFFSPDPFGVRSDSAIGLSVRALGSKYTRRLEAAGFATSSSSETPFLSVCSPRLSDKNLVITRSLHSAFSSTPEVNKIGTSRNDVGLENISILGETPLKRSFESPSAWNSPWFPNSFLLGSRGDADVTLEEMGKYLSPGNQSYDAIGLMEQLGEQTASAFANAQEVLGDETPQTILKKKCALNHETDGENNETSNIVAERRMLDFSDCGTPGKSVDNGKVAKAMSYSSPSSYLLKGCR